MLKDRFKPWAYRGDAGGNILNFRHMFFNFCFSINFLPFFRISETEITKSQFLTNFCMLPIIFNPYTKFYIDQYHIVHIMKGANRKIPNGICKKIYYVKLTVNFKRNNKIYQMSIDLMELIEFD